MKMNFLLPHKQQGAVFITGLVFLVVISLLGVTAMKTSTLEERMAGNSRDRNLALQAAEMGLRYAEQHILSIDPVFNTSGLVGQSFFDLADELDPGSGYYFYGMGEPAPGAPGAAVTAPAWETNCTPNCPLNYVGGNVFNTNGIAYTAPALPAAVPPPTYLIEAMKKNPPGAGGERTYYRITVRAQGAQLGTVVQLQEIFRP